MALMNQPVEPLSDVIQGITYFGDVVFAASGAWTAARHRMDVVGVVLIGVITAIGGGTLRDLLLDRPVAWVQHPNELILCLAAALAAYLVRRLRFPHQGAIVWADALGLAAFAVTGAHIALESGVPIIIAAFLGMLTATGGGVIRDLLTQTRPLILTPEIYATAALVGAMVYALLSRHVLTEELAGPVAFAIALAIRAAAISFELRFGVAGEPVIVARRRSP